VLADLVTLMSDCSETSVSAWNSLALSSGRSPEEISKKPIAKNAPITANSGSKDLRFFLNRL